jgi:hypothetical protein
VIVLDRLQPLLRVVCLILLTALLARVALMILRPNPVARIQMPSVPTLEGATSNSVPSTAAVTPVGMPGMPGMPGRGGAPLDRKVQARVDRIIQSEILGPAPRPLPMALLGIAGTNAFLRAPSGMSGMIGEGGELGGIRLLRIGTNRVLVDEGGTNRELTIFEGVGGQSLLPR